MQYAADSKYLAWQFKKPSSPVPRLFGPGEVQYMLPRMLSATTHLPSRPEKAVVHLQSQSASILEPHSWLKGLSYKRANPLARFLYRDKYIGTIYLWQELLLKPTHSADPPAESQCSLKAAVKVTPLFFSRGSKGIPANFIVGTVSLCII